MKNKTCCFTGHRDIPTGAYQLIFNKTEEMVERLIKKGYLYFGAGGALGFDTIAALAVLKLKEHYPNIRLILVLPCRFQTRGWTSEDVKIYENIKEQADKVIYTSEEYTRGCMHKRNRHLVDIMRIAVTYENGQIFQHFGHTETFKIYDVEEGKVVHSEVVDTNGSGHGALAGVLNALNADVLICGGIGGGAQTALAAAGIKLFGGVSGDADKAVEAFINKTLDYNPDVKCSHHEHSHGEGHTCGEHECGSHSCH